MMENFLLQLFIFLAASAIAVPIAKRFGLGSVLGYLIAGIVIGPFGISLIHDVEEVMHLTEFGVVMMLFLVGLELKPSMLWQMRVPILGMGGMQVFVSSLIICGVTLCFLPWQQAVAIGLILSLSSTAIVLQTLKEKGLMNTAPGRSVFSVLLFQDLAVIPMLALLPLLATVALPNDGHHDSALIDISLLPGYQQFIATILAVGSIFLLGKFASRPIFRAIAATQVREIFVAAALALVVGISLLMTVVGLSPALGTFLAGVVLADSEYRHELESDIEPFKGLLLGVFFISIGASLNFALIGESALLIAGMTAGLIIIKWLVLVVTGFSFKMANSERTLFAIALAQGGEFAFVLFQFSKVNGVLPAATIEPFISSVAISMFLTPLMFMAYEKFAKRSNNESAQTRESDAIDPSKHKVILAGFGRLGTDLGRFLLSAGVKPVIVDHDAANVDVLRKLGFKVYYGDITRLDLLEAAGAAEAEVLVITIGEIAKSRDLIELAQKHFPHLKVVVNAHDRQAAFQLMDFPVSTIRRETFGSALSLGQDTLQVLGVDPYEAHRLVRIFKKNDEEMMPELYQLQNEEDRYIARYQEKHADLETLMKRDLESGTSALDLAWTAKNPEL
ncbi:monovalent cation:proton antiporter-2 (CPA2) family protein [Shewanella gelidii]|uniref:Potassium transporter n=1 Tax=Shewanella gelidii TaxID=1642821 RepID=A0A917N7H7_9GAMM|nr:monovalent cation:proton antiporter-2 (CPA2) family protein [Shewanella gelidii]MCL1097397.1 monovalent cation:proton antiporter-2 (CPA2) family protein [Shewanella gelidii]GGI74849.1 potassium transporter [Shewanella gelidii]